jgi:Methyl-accepting chemotaxis protein
MMKTTVGTKIAAGFALALVILIAIGTVCYQSTGRLMETAARVTQTNNVLKALVAVTHDLVDAETGQRGYIITGEDDYLEPYNLGVSSSENNLRQLRALLADNPVQQQRLNRLEPLVRDRLRQLKDGIDRRRSGGAEAGREWILSGVGKEQMEEIRQIAGELEAEENALLAQRSAAAEASARNARLAVTLGTLGAFVILALAAFFITRDIAGPLRALSDTAERIARGDLSGTIATSDRTDEVGRLTQVFAQMNGWLNGMATVASRIASGDLRGKVEPQSEKDVLGQSFAAMVDNLQRLTNDLTHGVGVLGASASEISTSTSQLAASASETATAIGETTTTVEEVRQTAEISSQKARAVSDTAQRVAQISQTGRKATQDTVEGMTRIREQMTSIAESMVRLSEQSQAIGQIVATVEDLAAQSNLLAVNAAIEAAKAGEHGKGFTVVAQEVRSLAEQSKQATGQVRTILNEIQKATSAAVLATEQGSKAVEAGVEQSAQAGQSIQTLSGSISEAAQAAAQIAASSQQQLVGVDQVASAMESIKQASTQNVDSAKQLESAARDLKQLGEKLKLLIERYKV